MSQIYLILSYRCHSLIHRGIDAFVSLRVIVVTPASLVFGIGWRMTLLAVMSRSYLQLKTQYFLILDIVDVPTFFSFCIFNRTCHLSRWPSCMNNVRHNWNWSISRSWHWKSSSRYKTSWIFAVRRCWNSIRCLRAIHYDTNSK